jgi:hypothetical protein
MRINTQPNIKSQESTRKKIILRASNYDRIGEMPSISISRRAGLFDRVPRLVRHSAHIKLIGAIIILYGPNLTKTLRRMLSLH